MNLKRFSIIYLITLISLIFPGIGVNKILDGLDKPVFVVSKNTNPEYLYIVEQDGLIKLAIDGKINNKIFLDITSSVHQTLYPGDEQGLLGLALHPEFEKNGYIFVNYVDRNGFTIISRFKSNIDSANPASEKILFKIEQPYSNHNGGHLAFGPDGYLYIGLGDGGSSGDPEDRAQDLKSYFGKMLRIDINNANSDPYVIPQDNPFFNKKNIIKEIWAYGLRNPWRYSFDKLTGDLYIGDVGQNNSEEIDFQLSSSLGGINYGWNIMEAGHCFLEDNCNKSQYIGPIYEYPNNAKYLKTLIGINQNDTDGCSVTGGYVYRGKEIPSLYGHYIFGDYCTGKVWSFKYDNEKKTDFINHTPELMVSMKKKSFYLSSFGERENGELLLIDYNGIIYELLYY